jgi:hypothetical protein
MTEIIQAIDAHQWLLAFVLAWPVLLAVGKALGKTPLGPYLDMSRLPSWVQWLIGQGVAGVSTFVALVVQGVAPADAGLAAFLAAAGVEWTATAGKRVGRMLGGL